MRKRISVLLLTLLMLFACSPIGHAATLSSTCTLMTDAGACQILSMDVSENDDGNIIVDFKFTDPIGDYSATRRIELTKFNYVKPTLNKAKTIYNSFDMQTIPVYRKAAPRLKSKISKELDYFNYAITNSLKGETYDKKKNSQCKLTYTTKKIKNGVYQITFKFGKAVSVSFNYARRFTTSQLCQKSMTCNIVYSVGSKELTFYLLDGSKKSLSYPKTASTPTPKPTAKPTPKPTKKPNTKCPSCGGSGDCKYCGGSGDCSYCHGSGRSLYGGERCVHCTNGECIFCRNGDCSYCNGKGYK